MTRAATGGRWLIYGARSFAHTVSDLVLDVGGEVLGLIDDTGTSPEGEWPCVGTLDQARERFAQERPFVALGIGYSDLAGRWLAWQRLQALGWPLPALVHPRAYVARTANIAFGAMVMACAVVDRKATIGEASVLWPGAIVNHDSTVGVNSFLSPGAVVCGHASLGSHCFVGATAVLADESAVPDGSVLRMNENWSRGRR